MQISIRNQSFILHHLGAIYWTEQKMLLIADVHFGKVTHFRNNGIAIPTAMIMENFNNLDSLMDHFKPQTVVFLGDLFHSKINNEWTVFEQWISQQSQCKFVLVEGNHDVIDSKYYIDLNFEIYPQLIVGDFLLTHHPTEQPDLFNFCGHIHPGVQLKGFGRQFLKLSCFFQTDNQMIVPAFGTFTGKHFMPPTSKNTIYGIAETTVFKVKLQ